VILGRVELSRHNLNPRTTAITEDKIALRALLEKGSDATFLREMIGFAAERLMQLETEGLCGAAPGERTAERRNQRNLIRPQLHQRHHSHGKSGLPTSIWST
jgi:transposase-like protein